MKIIPFDPSISSRQRFNINLGELVCDFTFHWNSRASSWFCNFRTSAGENDSVRIVEKRALLANINGTGLPGDFRALKMNRMAEDSITYENFGTDWKLVYATHEEWEEFDGLYKEN